MNSLYIIGLKIFADTSPYGKAVQNNITTSMVRAVTSGAKSKGTGIKTNDTKVPGSTTSNPFGSTNPLETAQKRQKGTLASSTAGQIKTSKKPTAEEVPKNNIQRNPVSRK